MRTSLRAAPRPCSSSARGSSGRATSSACARSARSPGSTVGTTAASVSARPRRIGRRSARPTCARSRPRSRTPSRASPRCGSATRRPSAAISRTPTRPRIRRPCSRRSRPPSPARSPPASAWRRPPRSCGTRSIHSTTSAAPPSTSARWHGSGPSARSSRWWKHEARPDGHGEGASRQGVGHRPGCPRRRALRARRRLGAPGWERPLPGHARRADRAGAPRARRRHRDHRPGRESGHGVVPRGCEGLARRWRDQSDRRSRARGPLRRDRHQDRDGPPGARPARRVRPARDQTEGRPDDGRLRRMSCARRRGPVKTLERPPGVLSEPEWRVEGRDKVTGAARYAADVRVPNMLHAAFVSSPHAHARIVKVDASAARGMLGVRAVITGADVRPARYGRRLQDWPVLCWDNALFIGDRVAAVAADTPEIPDAAARAISVEYEELPAVLDPEAALAEDASVLHPDPSPYLYLGGKRPTVPNANVQGYGLHEHGDVDAAFASAHRTFEHRFTLARTHQGYIEPHATLLWLDGDVVRVVSTNKAPYGLRQQMAACLGLPEEKIVVDAGHIGGDFGGEGHSVDEFVLH